MVGKTIVPGKADEHIYVFDLNRDGNTEAFVRLRVPLKVSAGGTLPDGFVALLASYDRATGHWIPVLSPTYIRERGMVCG